MLARTWGEPPADFLELYRAHDGQVGEAVELLPSFAQLPVYLQFLCLHARTGEVAAYDHKAPDWSVIARSFGELLTRIPDRGQAGAVRGDRARDHVPSETQDVDDGVGTRVHAEQATEANHQTEPPKTAIAVVTASGRRSHNRSLGRRRIAPHEE